MPGGRPRGPNFRDPNRVRKANGRPRRLPGTRPRRSTRVHQTTASINRHLRHVRRVLVDEAAVLSVRRDDDAVSVREPSAIINYQDYQEPVFRPIPLAVEALPRVQTMQSNDLGVPRDVDCGVLAPSPEKCQELQTILAYRGQPITTRTARLLGIDIRVSLFLWHCTLF